ncbi:hypothetical protein CIPAW_05G256200 [Carya illinoinensis]|uniref:Uncharacterized protein n=1 Tax=Carya illinoinensis TaxID=32201 RepID=A0A8T1QMA3_CARIL|nr:hypothetical protein CIPAW_05G256200 [Carya illinoinensis]
MICLSLTPEQGSINSSLAAIRATQPSTIWLRYTFGVFPINCTRQIITLARLNLRRSGVKEQCNTSVTSFFITHLSYMLSFERNCKLIKERCKRVRKTFKIQRYGLNKITKMSKAYFYKIKTN